MRHPQHFQTSPDITSELRLRPVSGLASFDLPPSHDSHSGILANPHSLTVAGAAQVLERLFLTCFPFNLSVNRQAPQSGTNFSISSPYGVRSRRQKNGRILQTASTSHPYYLTYQHFSIYSHRMENELAALENKLALLIKMSGMLRAENHKLRQELAHALSESRLCNDKVDTTKARLEKLLSSLPKDK